MCLRYCCVTVCRRVDCVFFSMSGLRHHILRPVASLLDFVPVRKADIFLHLIVVAVDVAVGVVTFNLYVFYLK